MRSFIQGFLSLVFPNMCVACGDRLVGQERFLCTACLTDIPRTRFHGDAENPVQQIFWGRVPLIYATSFFYFSKGSRYQKMMHSFKYRQKKEIGLVLGQLLGAELKQQWTDYPDFVIPVPLHRSKLKKRGYNQSEWIARGISLTMQIPTVTDVLVREIANPTQTKKTRFERWKNVATIFQITRPLKDCHVLLVDDVITTGATLEACAQTLLTMENTRISIATLAYATI